MTTKEDPLKQPPSSTSSPDKKKLKDPLETTSSPACVSCNAPPLPLPNVQPPPYATVQRGDNNDTEKVCRICLDDDHPQLMMAPCKCKGSSKWVHKDCLNEWRTNERDRAFAHCTECQFEYHLIPPQQQQQSKPSWRRKAKFSILVSRDICFLTIVIQMVIFLLSGLLYVLDPDQAIPASINGQEYPVAVYYLFGWIALLICLGIYGSIMLCTSEGSLTDAIPSARPSQSSKYGDRSGAYRQRHYQNHPSEQDPEQQARSTDNNYNNNYNNASRSRHHTATTSSHHHCCYDCGYYYPLYVDGGSCPCCCCCCGDGDDSRYANSRSGGGNCCDGCAGCCNGCDNCGSDAGDCFPVICIVLIVLGGVMAVFGFLTGIVLCVVAFQRIVQRHVYLLHKRQLVMEFQVQDLAGYDLEQPIINNKNHNSNKPKQEADVEKQKIHATSTEEVEEDIVVPPTPVAPSAPILTDDDVAYLKRLGLK